MSTDHQMSLLIAKRASCKSQLTRFVKFVDNYSTESDIHDLKPRIEVLDAAYAKFDEVQCELVALDERHASTDEQEIFENAYFKYYGIAKRLIRDAEGANSHSVSSLSNDSSNSLNSSVSRIKMPEISVPKISGSCEAWPGFNHAFQSSVTNPAVIGANHTNTISDSPTLHGTPHRELQHVDSEAKEMAKIRNELNESTHKSDIKSHEQVFNDQAPVPLSSDCSNIKALSRVQNHIALRREEHDHASEPPTIEEFVEPVSKPIRQRVSLGKDIASQPTNVKISRASNSNTQREASNARYVAKAPLNTSPDSLKPIHTGAIKPNSVDETDYGKRSRNHTLRNVADGSCIAKSAIETYPDTLKHSHSDQIKHVHTDVLKPHCIKKRECKRHFDNNTPRNVSNGTEIAKLPHNTLPDAFEQLYTGAFKSFHFLKQSAGEHRDPAIKHKDFSHEHPPNDLKRCRTETIESLDSVEQPSGKPRDIKIEPTDIAREYLSHALKLSHMGTLKPFYSVERPLREPHGIKFQYSDLVLEYLELGHKFKPTPFNNLEGYPQYHARSKLANATIEPRIIFDLAARSSAQTSPNDNRVVRPNVADDLLFSRASSRSHAHALVAIKTKIYRQIALESAYINGTRKRANLNRANPNRANASLLQPTRGSFPVNLIATGKQFSPVNKIGRYSRSYQVGRKQLSNMRRSWNLFDPRARTTAQISANEVLIVSPTVADKIFFSYARSRSHAYALIIDNAKVYRQTALELAYRNTTRKHIISKRVKLIPPRSPHFGGLCEASVKSLKYHTVRMIGDTLLTYEALMAYLTEIEAILNSRSLTPLSQDPNDLNAFTPDHFPIGDLKTGTPERDYQAVPAARMSSWEHTQRLRQHFWTHQRKSYFLSQPCVKGGTSTSLSFF